MKAITFENAYISACATAAGTLEKQGPLGNMFDHTSDDSYFGTNSWEQAESEMARIALNLLMKKAGLCEKDIDLLLGGDLLDQCTATGFAANSLSAPYMGLYGACSTAAEALIAASVFVSSGYAQNAVAVASSHFCSSERQFRFPLEYGSQRTPVSQNTVTGAGAFLMARAGKVRVTRALVGRVTEKGVIDANNMGAAMAPAAADTILRFFEQTGGSFGEYGAVATGDLGYEGVTLLEELLKESGADTCGKLTDCGVLIYDRKVQKVNAGGSGCGCSACVLGTYFWDKLCKKEIKRMLIIGTGAMLSAKTALQKQTIPCVAHLLELEAV